jgi:O-antigen/teichoic acid export membrane protein
MIQRTTQARPPAAAPPAIPNEPLVSTNGHGPNGRTAAAHTVDGEAPNVSVAQASPAAPHATGAGRLVQNVLLLLSSQLVIWAVTFVSNVFVPRGLGPARMGELTVATSVALILDTVFALGYGALMVKDIARDASTAPGLVGTALTTRLLLLLPATGTVAVMTVVIHASPELTVLIWLAAASTFLGLFGGAFHASFQALERMQYSAITNVLSRAGVAVGSILLVALGHGPGAILGMTVAVSGLLASLLWWWWHRTGIGVDWTWDWGRARHLLVGSLPYWSTALLLSFYMWIDALMLSAMAPITVVGWYSVPVRLFATLLFLPTILGTAYLPRLARAFPAGHDALGTEARRFLELALTASFPITAGLLLVGWQLVWVLYGAEYLQSVPVLMIVALSLPPTYLNIVSNQILIAANKQFYWTWVMLGASIVNPLLNLVLIRLTQDQYGNGALGAAAALLLTETGMAVAGLAFVVPLLRWSTAARLGRAVAATLVMSSVVWLAARHFGLTTMVVAGGLSFVVAALALGVLRPDERRMALGLLTTAAAKLRRGRRAD